MSNPIRVQLVEMKTPTDQHEKLLGWMTAPEVYAPGSLMKVGDEKWFVLGFRWNAPVIHKGGEVDGLTCPVEDLPGCYLTIALCKTLPMPAASGGGALQLPPGLLDNLRKQ